MPLLDHLRELRTRLFRAVLAVVVATIVCAFFYGDLFRLIHEPFQQIREYYESRGGTVSINFQGVADPFSVALKICALFGFLLSSPIWLYQLWMFVTPGLHRHERRYAVAFLVVSAPLFLAGAYVAYLFLPKGFDLLIGFNPDPENVSNIISLDKYLSFVSRTLIVFGVSFVLPVFLIALNLAGVVTAAQLITAWRPVVLGAFVFAAVATPSGDPWTMTALATPMLVLYFLATAVCALTDRRRRRAGIDGVPYANLTDDEASPIAHDTADGAPDEPRPRPLVDDDVT
ncbi:MAG: twin-arginine translocase subunit TatC [Actinomycetota bacterium]|nr:twin-arginine translocase subunit TatC [Actinomycetota bacterium]